MKLIDSVHCTTCQGLNVRISNSGKWVDLIYADVLYRQPPDVATVRQFVELLKPGGAIWIQTDQGKITEGRYVGYSSSAVLTMMLDSIADLEYINTVIWSYDWGGRPKNAFGRKHDDLLYYVKRGAEHTFNAKAVAVKKVAMINSKKDWKIPTDVWTGNFYTTSPERIRNEDTGQGFIWQKPEWLMERILLACTNEGDLVYEPYLGTGTMCAVAKAKGRHYVGCDIKEQMVSVAHSRLGSIKWPRVQKK